MTDRWLDKKEYSRIRYKAKKMGATKVKLNQIWHIVEFDCVTVAFIFRPLQCDASIRVGNAFSGHFHDKDSAEAIKKNIDKASEFIDFLKKFEEERNGNNHG